MAFVNADLSQLTSVNHQGLYFYKSAIDVRATVTASGYFNNVDDDLNLAVDDRIMVTGAQGNYSIRVDTVSAAGVVTTAHAEGSIWLSAELTDVSTASSTWVAAPFDGFVGRIKTILHGAIATADALVGLEIAGVDVTGGQVTIANSGSAAGDVDESESTALNVVTEGAAVEIDTNGASTNTISVTCMVEFIPA